MKSYYRVMLGQKSIFADRCFTGNFIGVDFGIAEDLTPSLPDVWNSRESRSTFSDNHTEAVASFDDAIAINPDYAEAPEAREIVL